MSVERDFGRICQRVSEQMDRITETAGAQEATMICTAHLRWLARFQAGHQSQDRYLQFVIELTKTLIGEAPADALGRKIRVEEVEVQ